MVLQNTKSCGVWYFGEYIELGKVLWSYESGGASHVNPSLAGTLNTSTLGRHSSTNLMEASRKIISRITQAMPLLNTTSMKCRDRKARNKRRK